MHASLETITSAMQLYFTGESLRGVKQFLKLQGINMSHQSVFNWTKKYTKLMDNYLNTITPHVGEKWHADEVWLKVRGDRKYLFAIMDNETRFWISQVADSNFPLFLFLNATKMPRTMQEISVNVPLTASGIYHDQESSSRKNIIRPKAGAKRRTKSKMHAVHHLLLKIIFGNNIIAYQVLLTYQGI